MTDLAQHIHDSPLVDSHEHQHPEAYYLKHPPDVLQVLFDGSYIAADLVVAGARPQDIQHLLDDSDPDIAGRFTPVQQAWECCRHTGYGQAVRHMARDLYDLDELTGSALEAAQSRHIGRPRPGDGLRILRDKGRIDHVQIDSFEMHVEPDTQDPAFFLHDINWMPPAAGELQPTLLHEVSGVEVRGLASLREAFNAAFERNAARAIAVKTQHAYVRTLAWQPRHDSDVARHVDTLLHGRHIGQAAQLCLGDWCLARGIELATQHNLPIKIHTGYHAGHSGMVMDWIHPGHLSTLVREYPEARFVLMHSGYPYGPELIALAKHYPNVYVDLCWAWSIDPRSTTDFVRRFIHAVPCNKLFVFGGDTMWPQTAVAYAEQARHWLTRALQAEIDDGVLSEREAIKLASRFMRENQYACFDIEGTRAALTS
ncbi:MAG: amidohydrolase family protein [Phycisphaerae bacterium]|nr:amidohydrolase family protein [Phycisphaerae bacterium]